MVIYYLKAKWLGPNYVPLEAKGIIDARKKAIKLAKGWYKDHQMKAHEIEKEMNVSIYERIPTSDRAFLADEIGYLSVHAAKVSRDPNDPMPLMGAKFDPKGRLSFNYMWLAKTSEIPNQYGGYESAYWDVNSDGTLKRGSVMGGRGIAKYGPRYISKKSQKRRLAGRE